MFAVTGVTGKVGGAVARALRDIGLPVRAVVRDAAKGAPWAARGCNVAVADLDEVAALAAAFTGVGGAFAMLPPIFDPTPGFPEAKAMIGTLRAALAEALPPKLVVLSTVGADATRPSLLNQLGLLERALADLPNSSHVSAPRLVHGERGRGPHAGARNGRDPQLSATARPRRPHGRHRGRRADCGPAIAGGLGRPPYRRAPGREGDTKRNRFRLRQGTRPICPCRSRAPRALGGNLPQRRQFPRMQMVDGFNEGWIDFSSCGAEARPGRIDIDSAIAALVRKETSRME